PLLRKIKSKVPVTYYGFGDNNNVQARNIVKNTEGSTFDVYIDGEFYHEFSIHSYGDHNIENSLSVVALAYHEGLDKEEVAKNLADFEEVKGRCSEKNIRDTLIINSVIWRS